MKNNKYYTPTIEEFHVGFEYERVLEDKSISKEQFDFDGINCFDPNSGQVLEYIRVRYLDKEDIKSLGFEQQKLPYQFLHSSGIIRLVDLKHNKYSITHIADDCYLFYGEIKNKSELKRILKQIGENNGF